MDNIINIKNDHVNKVFEILENSELEIPVSIKKLAEPITKIVQGWLSSLSPDLPADQKATLATNIIDCFEDESSFSLFPGNAVQEILDLERETFDRLIESYEASQGEVQKLADRCEALKAVIDFKDSALESANAAKNTLVAAKEAEISLGKKAVEQLQYDLASYKKSTREAITILNKKYADSAAVLKDAGGLLRSRLNIAGIVFVALGAILIGAAYCFKDPNYVLPQTRSNRLNSVIQKFNRFMKDHHVGVARAGLAFTALGTACVISSQVALGRDVQKHLAHPETFWRS